ncbi:MAG: prolyl oligopeptidase family serine peptidase [Candidatus Omnitrophota bacterium]
MKKIASHRFLIGFLIVVMFTLFLSAGEKTEIFSPKDVLNTRTCNDVQISPNGQWIAYTVSVNRLPGDKPGEAYHELYVIGTHTRQIIPFITGKVSVSSIQWNADSSQIAFLMKRGENAKKQIWAIPVDGGEAIQVSDSPTDIEKFQWHPAGNKIAYITISPSVDPQKEKKLKDKGYEFIYYEENIKHKNLYMIDFPFKKNNPPEQLTDGITVWSFVFSPDGKTVAFTGTSKNLIDYDYMFKKIYLLDLASKKREQLTDNPGKLGNFVFSPDSTRIVYAGALDQGDHDTSQVFVINTQTREQKNLTVPDFRGHMTWVNWKDNQTVLYMAFEGVWSTLSLVPASGGKRTVILDAKKTGLIFEKDRLHFTPDFKRVAFIGSSPYIPSDIFLWGPGKSQIDRLTDINPWLESRSLGKQDVVTYKARDGVEIEGLLIYPVNYKPGQKYPLIVDVHGGPEGLYTQKWVTRYSTPGQTLAAKGYVVFFPNYRASSGYGYKFAREGLKDAAGKEFDDIADGIDFLVNKGIADKERVGLGGGSYGGYAAAWFASYYTHYVRAVCMFVGISDVTAKRGTTDIPYEEQYVHSGDKLENMWEFELKRSPVYWAHQCQTAVLIAGGADDPRVHPSQSMEFYRLLKMNEKPAVRLVQYPGEGHGNRSQPGQIDLLIRTLQWYDWYVMDKKDLKGPMPPLDISDCYGI